MINHFKLEMELINKKIKTIVDNVFCLMFNEQTTTTDKSLNISSPTKREISTMHKNTKKKKKLEEMKHCLTFGNEYHKISPEKFYFMND